MVGFVDQNDTKMTTHIAPAGEIELLKFMCPKWVVRCQLGRVHAKLTVADIASFASTDADESSGPEDLFCDARSMLFSAEAQDKSDRSHQIVLPQSQKARHQVVRLHTDCNPVVDLQIDPNSRSHGKFECVL